MTLFLWRHRAQAIIDARSNCLESSDTFNPLNQFAFESFQLLIDLHGRCDNVMFDGRSHTPTSHVVSPPPQLHKSDNLIQLAVLGASASLPLAVPNEAVLTSEKGRKLKTEKIETLLRKRCSFLTHSLYEASITKAPPRYIKMKFLQRIRASSGFSVLEQGIPK
ncbi:hypothetical protein Salat_0189400 [Sesamum alatum]|uniref:Uncharacterized protein n=1 Tax=Sesamum alatum TaxID=300844 RepID=A0AAE1YXP5_9LAMI|nr:hypothetical protein Salat_0189400 [Sesamum alatum]